MTEKNKKTNNKIKTGKSLHQGKCSLRRGGYLSSSDVTILLVFQQAGIMVRDYAMEHKVGFPPTTLRKYSMNTCVPAICVSGIDY